MPDTERKDGISDTESSSKGPVFWQKPVLFIPAIIILLLILAAAAVVVVRNAGRVQLGPAPVPLGPITPDTTMSRVRRQLARGIGRLERRLAEYRAKVETLSTVQESLYKSCTQALERLRLEYGAVESARTYQERKERFGQARKSYVRLRNMVNDFVFSVDSLISGRVLDSLDREFQRLISE